MTRPPVLRLLAAGCWVLALGVCLGTGWGEALPTAVPAGVQATSVVATSLLACLVAAAAVVTGRPAARGGAGPRADGLLEAAVAASLVVVAGPWTVVAVGLGVAAGQRLHRSAKGRRQVEPAARTLAASLACAVTSAAGGDVVAAGLGTAVFWAVSCVLLAGAVSLTSARPLGSLLVSRARVSGLRVVAGGSAGLLAGFLALESPVALLGLAVPAIVGWVRPDGRSATGEARVLAELAREPGRTQDASAELLLTAAARLLGGADVELLVLTADGPVRFTGDESDGRVARGPAGLDEPWVQRALQAGAQTGREGGRPFATAVLGAAGAPVAVLRARRPSGAAAFDSSELRLTELLAAHAGALLSPPAAPPSDEARDELAPARDSVRASARRLADLAAWPDADDEVVAELHALSQSVAVLVGARAAGDRAEDRLRRGAGGGPVAVPVSGVLRGLPTPRAAVEAEGWTTTGVLR